MFAVDASRAGRTMKLAHRVSWELHYGAIPKGMLVLHRCDNPPCTRVDHLFLGTHKVNRDDCVRKGRVGHAGGAPSKLTAAQVAEIRTRYVKRQHPNQYELASEYGVSQACINNIVHS
jgi:hypothetical protein